MQKFSIHDDYAGFYRQHGYVVFTDLVPLPQLRECRRSVLAIFERRLGALNPDGVQGDELLTRFYHSHKDAWRQAARRMADVPILAAIASDPDLVDVVQRLGLDEPIFSTRPEVRTDMPGDQDYRQPWHQDWRYGQPSINGVTFWIPLQDVSAANGTIDIQDDTHVLGYLETEEIPNPRRFSIVDPRIEAFQHATCTLSLGESVVFSQLLVHRSGFNSTDRPRLSIQLRFTDAADAGFIEAGMPLATGSDLVWPHPPTEAEARAWFQQERVPVRTSRTSRT